MSDYRNPQVYAAQPADPNYVAYLEQRIRALEAKTATSLVSGGFFGKAFSVWGYYFVAQTVISLIVFVLALIVSLIFGAGLAGLFSNIAQSSRPTY